jgi:hypothetical protein
MSKFEREFRRRFPHARVTTEPAGAQMTRYTVFAGNYICAFGLSKRDAFKRALEDVNAGFIQPDPDEVAA